MAKQTRTFPITVARQKTVAMEAVKYERPVYKWGFSQSFGSDNAIASEKNSPKTFDVELFFFL